jgi:hypothetical protein
LRVPPVTRQPFPPRQFWDRSARRTMPSTFERRDGERQDDCPRTI